MQVQVSIFVSSPCKRKDFFVFLMKRSLTICLWESMTKKPHRLTSAKSEASVNYELAYHSSGASANLLREFKIGLSAEDHISTFYAYYEYGGAGWKDKLTSYNGQTISYDEIGNPVSYRGTPMT